MGSIGPLEIGLLILLALLLFGAKRLPEIGRSLGTGMREFKDSVTGENKHEASATHEASELPPPQPVAAPPAPAATEPAEPGRETEPVGH